MMYDIDMLGKVLALSTLCAFVLLSALMQSTTPSSIHPLGILFVFFLVYLLVLGVLTFLLYIGASIVLRVRKREIQSTALLKRSYVYSSVLSLAPVMIIGISSIGRMGIYEFLLVVIFEAVVCFYVAKHRS